MFTKQAPPIPVDSPLAPYARYMLSTINDIWLISTIRIVADLIMLALLLTFLYWVVKLCRKVDFSVESAKEDRRLSSDILKVVKGWTVVSVSTDKRKIEDIKDVREAVELVPEKTAHKVIEKIAEGQSSESGTGLRTTDSVLNTGHTPNPPNK